MDGVGPGTGTPIILLPSVPLCLFMAMCCVYAKAAGGEILWPAPIQTRSFLPLSRQTETPPERYAIQRNIEKNIYFYALNPEAKDLSFETDKPFITLLPSGQKPAAGSGRKTDYH